MNEFPQTLEHYKILADNTLDLLTTHTLEGHYQYCSPSVEEILGYKPREMVGKTPYQFFHPDDSHRIRTTSHEPIFRDNIHVKVVYRILHKNGSYRWLETKSKSITIPKTNEVIALAMSRDITEQMQYREEILNLNETLESRIAERTSALQRLNLEMRELMNIAVHDLKNPLTNILMNAEILEQFVLNNDKAMRYINVMKMSNEIMLKIISNLLDVNRLEGGQYKMHFSPLNLDVVGYVVNEYQMRATSKGVILLYEKSFDVTPPNVWVDEQSFIQVLDNLISNAIKFSPKWRKVWVRVLTVRKDSGEHCGRVEVQDQGPGISDEDKKHLFEKFSRLSAQPTAGENSTGLGLSIVKKLVEAMNGQVWYENGEESGAKFIVELPLAPLFLSAEMSEPSLANN